MFSADVDRDELAAVVDGDRVADHVRNDRRAAGPGLDDLLLPRSFSAATFFDQVVVDERALLDRTRHRSALTLRLAAADDESVRPLVVAGLEALGLPAPRRGRVAAAGGLALAAAHRVVDRVHRDAAVVRPPAQPAVAAGLADRDVLVLEVADLADRRVALDVDLAHLARGQPHLRVVAFLAPSAARAAPAERTIWPPLPRFSSMLWIVVPSGIACSGSALPATMSAVGPTTTCAPTSRPFGARM